MKNKCILVGVTGGIAAYKICSLVSKLRKLDNEVHVVMTKEAEAFVGPLTFQTLSNQRVITDMFAIDFQPDVHHVSLAKKADLFVIAPATANVIAKLANGMADDMLTTTFLAAECPKVIVPAMNTHMLENPVTRDNIAKCASYGMHIMESDSGYLACGDSGRGRMPEPERILDFMDAVIEKDRYLCGKKVLITAGPTRESLDPVRYLTNHSSGKMGYALARAARNAGADVTLISGQCSLDIPVNVTFVDVTSAADMAEAVLQRSDEADAVLMAAAIADYRPAVYAENKIKKQEGEFSLELERTTDILRELGKRKKNGQTLIGFAMETENLLANAGEKLTKKNADFIIANSINEEGAGFQVDTNSVTIISAEGQKKLGLLSKDETAEKILAYCLKGEKGCC